MANNSFQGANLTDDDGTPNPLLKAAVESANDAIIITEAELDPPGPRMEYVNAAFTRMTGYESSEVLGRTPRLLQGPKTDRGLLRRLRDDLSQQRSFHGETINYRKDGTEYYVEWRITPLFGQDGRVEKWVAIQRDVTERVRAEQERERLLEREQAARTEAERQSRMKDEFLATLGHELRTPLNAIVGWSHLLRSKSVTMSDVAEGMEVIDRNARAQTQLIEDLLDMSRIITGKVRLDVQRVDLAVVIDAAMGAVQHAAAAKGVKLHRVIDPLAGPVGGDPSRLQQVVWNLLANAVKFTPSGGRVQVMLERVNSHVELAVSDTGAGISPAFLPHVFDRFSQENNSSTRQHGGLGIGLSIVKQLVELHGGQVRAKSMGEGQGSTFVVALPLSLVHAAAADELSARDGHPDGHCPPVLKRLKILIVDDDPDARELMRRVLTDCEADVRTAANATEALAEFDRDPPDVYVSDIGMPGMDGHEAIKRIRARTPAAGGHVPAVAVTAYARSDDRRKALVAGFDMHVSKPIEPAELLAIISRLSSRRA